MKHARMFLQRYSINFKKVDHADKILGHDALFLSQCYANVSKYENSVFVSIKAHKLLSGTF